jgi:hypothetical protein
MAQQHLNGAQVGAGFEQVSREAVAQRVGVKLFADSRAVGGFAAGVPDDFGADGIPGGGMPAAAREEPFGRFPAQSAKVLPEFFEQMRAEHYVAVFAPLAAAHVDHHALAVDIADLQIRQLGPSNTSGIESHQDRAVKRNQRRFDQARHFFLTEDYRQVKSLLRIGRFLHTPWLLQCLDEKEAQGADALIHCVVGEFAIAEQMRDVGPNLLRAELIGWALKIAREVLDGPEIGARGTLRVITTLEFLEHHFS